MRATLPALLVVLVMACAREAETITDKMVTVPAGPVRGILDPCSDEVIEGHVDAFDIDYEPVTRKRFREWLLTNPTRLGRKDLIDAYDRSELSGYVEVKDRSFANDYCKERGLEPPTVAQLRRAGAASPEQWDWGNNWRRAPVCIVPNYVWCLWTARSGVLFFVRIRRSGEWATSRRCLRPFPYDVTGHDREISRNYRFLREVHDVAVSRCVRRKPPMESRATGG